jgi:hypothetical protein
VSDSYQVHRIAVRDVATAVAVQALIEVRLGVKTSVQVAPDGAAVFFDHRDALDGDELDFLRPHVLEPR